MTSQNGTYPEVKNRTLRHGGSKQANTDEMNELLNKIREDEMRCSLVMIEEGAYSNFDKFASSGASAGQKWKFDDILKDTTGSIEALHGDYHSYIGGFSDDDGNNTGHMSCVPVAAFDVAFFTHHTQIDRLYAIWQASNGEEQWFNETQPKKQYLGEFPLTPFRRGTRAVEGAEQEFWNPTTARDTTVFGYTYPETQGRELGRDAGQADQVRSDFARQYAWSRRLDVNQNFDSPPEDMMPLPVETAQVFQYTDGVESAGFLKKVGIRVHPRPKLSARMTAAPAVAETALPTPKVSQEWYIDVVVER